MIGRLINLLLIGNCGVGKTYVMQKLINKYKCFEEKKVGLLRYNSNGWLNITGVYDGSMFQGSDKLSMSVMTSIHDYLKQEEKINIYEGDRFTNNTFITAAKPTIIKILGTGNEGRAKRGSTQTQRHIDSINTRVNNIKHNYEVPNSTEAIQIIETLIFTPEKDLSEYKPKQQSLF